MAFILLIPVSLPAQPTPAASYVDLLARYRPQALPDWDKEIVGPLKRNQEILKAQEAAEAHTRVQVVVQPKAIPAPSKPLSNQIPASNDVQAIIAKWAGVYGVSVSQLLRVAQCESGFNIYAKNPSGATGLFQFMPQTFYGHGGVNIYSADDQARVAAMMFSQGQSGQWVCK